MRIRPPFLAVVFAPVLALGLALVLAPLLGCGVHAQGYPYGVFQAPPPPHVEVVDARPGYIWVNGEWSWSKGEWHWQGGHYEAKRPGKVWEQGQWEKRGKGAWFWREGNWHSQ